MQEKYTLQLDLNNNGTDWDINIRQPENQTLTVENTATMLAAAITVCVRSSTNPEELINNVISQLNAEFEKIYIDDSLNPEI
jgi:hypothetical protein